MNITNENLYYQIGKLLEEMPDLTGGDPLSSKDQLWLGRAYSLIALGKSQADAINFKVLSDNLLGPLRDSNVQGITAILYRALAVAELDAPSSSQGSFIPIGKSFDSFNVLLKIFEKANTKILIVDPYLDAKVFSEYCVLAHEHIKIELLTDKQTIKPNFEPAFLNWKKQYLSSRPVEVRYSKPRTLHDRSIIVDERNAWILTQSLNSLAHRSPATISKLSEEIAKEKIDAYLNIWDSSDLLV